MSNEYWSGKASDVMAEIAALKENWGNVELPINVFANCENLPENVQYMPLTSVMVKCGAVKSLNEAKRLIKQGGVRVEGVKIDCENLFMPVPSSFVYRFGKKNYQKLNLEPIPEVEQDKREQIITAEQAERLIDEIEKAFKGEPLENIKEVIWFCAGMRNNVSMDVSSN